jgi:hypothetical protein
MYVFVLEINIVANTNYEATCTYLSKFVKKVFFVSTYFSHVPPVKELICLTLHSYWGHYVHKRGESDFDPF